MSRAPTSGGHDVVVVGGGMAGSAVAAVAAQAGLGVVLVDAADDPTAGGNSALGGGGMHVGRADLRSDPGLLRERILGRALGTVQTGVVDAIAQSAGAAMIWMLEQGVELLDEAPGDIASILAPERDLTDSSAWRDRGPQQALRVLQTRAVAAGAELRPATTVRELTLDAGGGVTGVVTDAGERLAARAVVLCDGGFQLDRELVARHLTSSPDSLFLRCARTGGGAGLRMAEAAGARLVNVAWHYSHCLHADVFHNDGLWPWPALDEVLTDGAVLIGADGRRLVDEGRGGVLAANVVSRLDDPRSTWVVLGEAMWEEQREHEQVWGHLAANPEFERRGARIERAPDVAALATATGVDADGLTETLGAYGDAADAGTSADLAVPRTGVARRIGGALVAFPLAVGLSHTTGGPAIDGDGRVLREDGAPVRGLFAAGAGAAAPSGGYFGGYSVALTIGVARRPRHRAQRDRVMTEAEDPTAELLLSDADRAVRARVRALVHAEVAPRAADVDRRESFPEDGMRALAAAGLAGLLTPSEYGGAGASTVAYAAAMEELTAACGSTSTVFMTQMHCAHPIELAGTEDVKRRVLPELAACTRYGALGVSEPEAGSDVAAMRTTARRDGDGYVVNGSKTFITTGDRAGAIVLFATVDPSLGRDGITAFLVEHDPPGLRRGAPMHKMGLRGSSTTELFFDDCRLPFEACLGGEGNGYSLSMRSVVNSRISASAQGVGHAVGAYRAAVAWAGERGLLSARRRDAQRVQFRLADMRSRIAAGRVLLYATAALVDRTSDEPITAVSTAKLRCTDLGVEIATEAVDLLGVEGDLVRWGVERRLRDAKVAEIYDGTNEVQRMIVARDIRRRAEAAAHDGKESA